MSKTNKTKRNITADLMDNMGNLTEEMEIKSLKIGDVDSETGKVVMLLDVDDLTEAPKEWDEFPEPTQEEFLRLKFSIIENGLINPIRVWDRGHEKVIIAGKTRKRVYASIRDNQEGKPDVDYSKIPAILYEKNEIDIDKAKNIIVESNTEQRSENTRDLPFVVKHKVRQIERRKNKKGDTMDQVAKELNLSRTKIYEEKVLASEIDSDIVEMFYRGILNRKTVLRFKKIDKSAQHMVYERLLKNMTRDVVKKENIDERSKKLRKGMNFEEIKYCLTHDPAKSNTYINIKVPTDLEEKFMEMAKKWLEENNDNKDQ